MAQQRPIDLESSKNLLRFVTTNERGPYLDRNAIPTLDLHGFLLESAIKKLVQFLEQHYAQPKTRGAISDGSSKDVSHAILQVVTGTGSHSTSAGGPVLKYAVNDFLHRHSFQYTYHSKGGYFVIPIYNNTGVLSYQSNTCSVSTKLIIKSHCAIDKTFGNHLKRSHVAECFGLKPDQKQPPLIPTTELPTLQEVVHDEKELQRGMNESLDEYRKRQKEYAKERKLYQEAIQVSNNEIKKLEEEEKLMLERVVQESVELSERENDDIEEEEIALKQAIMESLEESEHEMNDGGIESEEDDLLQRVIMESKALHDASERDDDDDDDFLRRALLESEKYF